MYYLSHSKVTIEKIAGGKKMFSVDKKLSKSNIARTIRFTEDIFNDLLRISTSEDVSFNQLVLQCCRYALDNYEGNEQNKR